MNPASAYHGWLAALVGVCMALAAFFDRYSSAVAFGLIALFSVVGHVFVLRAQQRRTREQVSRPVADDRIRVVEAGGVPPVQRWVRIGTGICLVGALAIVPVCLLPALLVELSGWPWAKSSDQGVVSPGDTVKLWLDGPSPPSSVYSDSITNATVVNADELGVPAKLPVSLLNRPAHSDTSRQNNDDPRTGYVIGVVIPNDPKWAGKTARVRVDLMLKDADKQGSGWSILESVSVDIPIAPEGAGPMYRASWRVALLGGAVPAVLLGFVLGGLAGTPRPKQPPRLAGPVTVRAT